MALPGYSPTTPDDRTTVICLYCHKPMEVGRKAMTITCRHCHKPLKLEDLRFKGFDAKRTIDTCGIITIEQKANVSVTERVNCGGLIVRGKLKGAVNSRGPVLIGPDAEVKGDVTAPSLAVGAGAILDGHYAIGPRPQASADPAAAPSASAAHVR